MRRRLLLAVTAAVAVLAPTAWMSAGAATGPAIDATYVGVGQIIPAKGQCVLPDLSYSSVAVGTTTIGVLSYQTNDCLEMSFTLTGLQGKVSGSGSSPAEVKGLLGGGGFVYTGTVTAASGAYGGLVGHSFTLSENDGAQPVGPNLFVAVNEEPEFGSLVVN